jgi:hypothetical protein
MTPEEKSELKRQITKRWFDPSITARAQLEYILQEAGLLARPRRRLAKIKHLEADIAA